MFLYKYSHSLEINWLNVKPLNIYLIKIKWTKGLIIMMDYSSSRLLTSMHPSIRQLNIRNVSKIVTSKIIRNTALQMQYNPDFCRRLGVSTYLNTHIGLAYFIDDRYFDHYGLQPEKLINFSDVYAKLVNDFYVYSGYQPDQLWIDCNGAHKISKTNMQ